MQFPSMGPKQTTKFNHRHYSNQSQKTYNRQHNNDRTDNKNIFVVVPYTRGLGERLKKACNSLGIQVNSKGSNTFCSLLVASKDKDTICSKSGVIYHFKCPQVECLEEYIGKSGRTFGDRLREHLRALMPHLPAQPDHRTPS